MKIEFPCGGCNGPVLAGFEHIGKRGRCPHCDAAVIVPFVRFTSGDPVPDAPAPPGRFVDENARLVQEKDADRRNFVRFAVEDCVLRLARTAGHLSPYSYPVKDMSRGGVAFIIGSTPGIGAGIAVGEALRLTIDVQAFAEPLELSGEVRRVDPEGPDGDAFVIGVELSEMSTMDRDRIARLEESEELRRKTRDARK